MTAWGRVGVSEASRFAGAASAAGRDEQKQFATEVLFFRWGFRATTFRLDFLMPDISPIHPATRIGHVHLKVADLERALAFYCGVLGFQITQRYGQDAAFISAGGYHHHIGLNTWESRGGSPPPRGSTGLFHLAILYPTRAELADALRRLLRAGIKLDGASDHGVSEALYLRDPDENGVELCWDRPREKWPTTAGGRLQMFTHPLDLEGLIAETPISI